jgi:hypothetical protein
MKVQELIEKLRRCDHDAVVNVAVRVHTQAHAVAVVEPFELDRAYQGCTLWISLPANMHTVERKPAGWPR